MRKEAVPAAESFAQWRNDAEYVAAYDALEGEFALEEALIKARATMAQRQSASECTRAFQTLAPSPKAPYGN